MRRVLGLTVTGVSLARIAVLLIAVLLIPELQVPVLQVLVAGLRIPRLAVSGFAATRSAFAVLFRKIAAPGPAATRLASPGIGQRIRVAVVEQ